MKGPSGHKEVAAARPAFEVLGGIVSGIHRYAITGVGERDLIVVHKTRATPKEYPREANLMKKRPLAKK
jgi:16S rRNA (guanine527-N7)-methyltransferase